MDISPSKQRKQTSLLSFFSKSIKKQLSPQKHTRSPIKGGSPFSKSPQAIPGLFYFDSFLDESESSSLLTEIYKRTWNTSLKRRTQHYGYAYDYMLGRLDLEQKAEPIPHFLQTMKEKLQRIELLKDFDPDQVIINEYTPGQGISHHIDKIRDFEERICSISLGSDTIMEFKRDSFKHEILLRKNSIVIITGDARYVWTHGIPARKADKINGVSSERSTRVSLTFRKKK